MSTSPYCGTVVSHTLSSGETVWQGPSGCSQRESLSIWPLYLLSSDRPLTIAALFISTHSLTPKPLLLFYHFFSVAFYSIYILFTRGESSKGSKPGFGDYPALMLRSGQVVSPRHCTDIGWTRCTHADLDLLPSAYNALVLDGMCGLVARHLVGGSVVARLARMLFVIRLLYRKRKL